MSKIDFLSKNLPEQIDAVLITSEQNRRYYTGFPSSAGILLVAKECACFFIDFRYYEAACAQVRECEVSLLEDTKKCLREFCEAHQIRTVAGENTYLTIADFHRYSKLLEPVMLTDDSAADRLILFQRRNKTREEVEQIIAAQCITEDTFDYIINHIKPGRTEQEIALEMEMYLRKQGAEAVSFDFIVVSGANSAKPHGVPTAKPIANGDLVTMDFGAVVGGYHSDMTRTIGVGALSEQQREVYQTVLEAQQAGLDAIRIGRPCSEVDKAARDVIDGKGFAKCFGHGLGHSVGIEIHENPRFSTLCSDPVEAGIVMTVEPGIYLSGEFGVRIEDMVYVTENGVENLTHSPKNLIIL